MREELLAIADWEAREWYPAFAREGKAPFPPNMWFALTDADGQPTIPRFRCEEALLRLAALAYPAAEGGAAAHGIVGVEW
jgi:hypothetical protein